MEINVRQFSSDKILKHLDRVNEWLEGKNPPPITVELDMTNLCNHKCPECSGWYLQDRNHDSLPDNLAKEIVGQLAKAKIRGLIFTGGGEPLCHPGTSEVVRLAHRLGLDVGFITNGSLITEEVGRVLLECCTWLRISLDAASSKTFEKVHGIDRDAFQRVVDNIRRLTQLKRELNHKITIGVGYQTCDYTADEMFEATKLAKRLNVDYLQFRPMQMHNGHRLKYHLTDISENINRCMNEGSNGFKVLYSKHKYDMMHDKEYGRNYKKCYGQQFATVIAANAKMYLCCHTRGYDKYRIGDLKKNTFEEIWDSQQRKKVVDSIDFKECPPLCRDNTFNQILWNIKQPSEHVNFL